MAFENILEAYIRVKQEIPPDVEIKDVTIKHEEGWSGEYTDWPASVEIEYKTLKIGAKGQKHWRKRGFYYGDDPVELIRELVEFAESSQSS